MKVTAVRAYSGQHTTAFQAHDYVGIGWFDEPISDPTDYGVIRDAYRALYPNDGPYKTGQNVGQIYRFLNHTPEGSIVLTPFQPPDTRVLIGRVRGPSYFEKDGTSPFYYRLPVVWEAQPLDRHAFTIPLQNTLGSLLTVFNVKQVAEVCKAAGLPYEGTPGVGAVASVPLGETDAVYQALHAKLCELDADEFEQLVSYVLRTLGFESSQQTGKVGDGGVDFEGELTVFGIASVQLQVQVKRYEAQRIGEPAIRNFRGALKKGRQGCFITLSDFHKKAVASASDTDKVPIQLVNGRRFVDILTQQYDRVMELILNEDNEALADKLQLKRVLIPA
jgi:restriction system protein